MSLPKRHRADLLVLGVVLLATAPAPAQTPLGTAFTYQGRLMEGANPADGSYDLRFTLFGAPVGGSPIAPSVALEDITVAGGLFTVPLDFGAAAFAGNASWMEVAVRPGASTGAHTTVGVRQALTATPNALFSVAARNAPWAGITAKPAGFADDVDNDSGGDITGVTAGAGLTGGGATGSVAVGVDFTGSSGSADAAARSDHHHLSQIWNGTGGIALTINNPGTALNIDSAGATAVIGQSSSAAGITNGVWGRNLSTNGRGVYGQAFATSGATNGVYGTASSPSGIGVYGQHLSTTGTKPGVLGETSSTEGGAAGVVGRVRNATAPFIGDLFGVMGVMDGAPGTTGAAVYGLNEGVDVGVAGVGGSGGVEGYALTASGVSFGIYGSAPPAGFAGYFSGRVHVTGTLSKGGGAFKIDHPLDPAHKYLYHSFVESPDMMNVYNGNVTTDAAGEAIVELPEWFEALNRDFRYQLTVIGQFARAMVAKEIEGNAFTIRTDQAYVKVSWQVTGIRQDAFANAHRIPVEEDKAERERGRYIHPEAHGQPPELGIDANRRRPRGPLRLPRIREQ